MIIHAHFTPKVFLVSQAPSNPSCVDERPTKESRSDATGMETRRAWCITHGSYLAIPGLARRRAEGHQEGGLEEDSEIKMIESILGPRRSPRETLEHRLRDRRLGGQLKLDTKVPSGKLS